MTDRETVIEAADAMDGNGREVPGAELADVIRQVKQAFYLVAKEPGSDRVPLKGVELTLKTVLEWTISAGPKFKIPFFDIEIELGHEITREQTHVIEVSLKRPPATETLRQEPDLVTPLADGLRTIRRAVEAAATGDPPLQLDEGSLELQFAVTHDSKVKLLVFSGGHKRAWTHTLKVIVGESEQQA